MSNISPGDAVVVVRDCCGKYLGIVYGVSHLMRIDYPGSACCAFCRWQTTDVVLAYNVQGPPTLVRALPVAWLKKLEPPVESVEEINRLWLSEPRKEEVS